MSTFIPNLRSSGLPEADVRQAYVDTPGFVYSDQLAACGGISGKIGTVNGTHTVAVVGAGPAGCCAAFELQKCGFDVTLYDAETDHIGGRLYSKHFQDGSNPSADIAELGAMRFPPTEEVLYYYLKAFGIKTTEDFPDPGKEPTLISYQGNNQIWSNAAVAPTGFETVHNGFVALLSNGIKDTNSRTVFNSSSDFQTLLKTSATNETDFNTVVALWQKYINEFENDSWYTGLAKIFGPQHKWAVPGDQVWAEEDFTRFGTLGIGSGGFGPLYNIGFLYIYRLLTNALETDQKFVPAGISKVAEALITNFRSKGGTFIQNKTVVNYSNSTDSPELEFSDGSKATFNSVIISTSTRAMEMGTNAADFGQANASPNAYVVDDKVAEAIVRTHEISSTKLFLRTKKFWRQKDAQDNYIYPRNILSDTKLPQVYTLEYDPSKDPESSGVVLLTYTWEDDAIKTQALTPEERLTLLKTEINKLTVGTDYADYSSHLVPFTGNINADLQSIDWQSTKNYYGAFTLARPGQDHYVNTMFRDFRTKITGARKGVYFIAGDCLSWTGGWAEGALHTGLNAAAAIVEAHGKHSVADNPITRVGDKDIYNYFPEP